MQGLRALRKGAEGLEAGGRRIGKTPVGHSGSGRAWLGPSRHPAHAGPMLPCSRPGPARGGAEDLPPDILPSGHWCGICLVRVGRLLS